MTAVLAGCGVTGGDGDVRLTLVAADYDLAGGDSTEKYWAGLTAAYEASHPGVDIDVRIESWNDVDRVVAELVDAGKAPDLAQIGAYADHAAAGRLYSADELLSVPVQANFLAPLISAGEMRRVQYGMPFAASTRLLFYNKKLFARAGVAKAPTTWDELADDARKLKRAKVPYPFALPLGPEEAQAETMMWLLSGGDGYTDDTGRYVIDSDANVDTFRWLKTELVDKGLTGPVAPGKLNRKAAFAAFSRGEVGMLNGHPSLMKEAAKQGVDVGMVPLPGRDERPRAAMGVADWIMAFKQNGHRREAGDFLNYVFSDANVLKFAGDNDLLPSTVSASHAMEDDPEHKALAPFLKALPDSRLYPVGKTSWARVSDTVKRNIGRAVEPAGSPDAVLATIGRAARTAEDAE
ncbi:extracellular solute-binding protein [Streptomyces tritici]|uniref:extracellular solute-binding protein n=1 Tax=Streptomyces tritici TaxID=2054410 RepID=UPI003AF13532